MTKRIHVNPQGKGGVGKSLVANLLAQAHLRAGISELVCVDCDPVNATLSGFKKLPVRRLEVLENGTVNTLRFDQLMSWLLEEPVPFVVDGGASTFLPFVNYLVESDALGLLDAQGREVMLHTVITGGVALRDTLAGFDWLARNTPERTKIVVWLNEYFGPIEAEGRPFEKMQVCERNAYRLAAILTLPRLNPQTFGHDFRRLLDRKLTFAEAAADPGFDLMARQRLAMLERQFLDQIVPIL